MSLYVRSLLTLFITMVSLPLISFLSFELFIHDFVKEDLIVLRGQDCMHSPRAVNYFNGFQIQICNACLCWYWKDNVLFKYVMHVYAGIGKTTSCASM